MFIRKKHVPFFSKKALGNRPFQNGDEGGGSGTPPVDPPAPPAVTPPAPAKPVTPPVPPPVAPPAAPPAPAKEPAKDTKSADPGDNPEMNALKAQMQELLGKLDAKEKREAELAEKVARSEAQAAVTKLYGDLGYSDNPKAHAVLNELIANRTFFRDGVQYWKTQDGKSLTMEQGLREFQKDLGSLFLRDQSRVISQTRQPPTNNSSNNQQPNQPRGFGGQRKGSTIAQAVGRIPR